MQGKVPVGVTSVAGYTITLAGVVGAVLAFLKGDRSDQTLGVLAAGGTAVLAFLSTQLGRYAQAHAAVKKAPVHQIATGTSFTKTGEQLRQQYEQARMQLRTQPDEPGDSAPPEAALHPLTDPSSIPPDVGDGEAEGSA